MDWEKDWKRVLMHVPIGLLYVYCCACDAMVGLGFIAAFMVYEINEDFHLKDRAYIDVHGLAIGIVMGAVIWRWWVYLVTNELI